MVTRNVKKIAQHAIFIHSFVPSPYLLAGEEAFHFIYLCALLSFYFFKLLINSNLKRYHELN